MRFIVIVVFLVMASMLVIHAAVFESGLPTIQEIKGSKEGVDYYEKHIRPLFAQHCQGCHGPQKQKGGLRLDSSEAIKKGGDTGVIVQSGKPEQSLLFQAVSYHDELKMPPRGKLLEEQIAHIRRWIELGAALPAEEGTAKTKTTIDKFDLQQRLKHWSYQPIQNVKLPVCKETSWPLTSIDSFIHAKLVENGLQPAKDTSKHEWLRRVTFDLIGLPPTISEIENFIRDTDRQAYDRVVDRLLSSQAYGERWGRHWLDLMRYADTLGHEFDFDLPNAWRYRNYVIRAFNDDVPYNQFVLEHLAGDLLPYPRMNAKEHWNESIQATGFLWLGEAKQAPVDVRQEQADRIDNQIDVIGKAFLGQTIACARCHDHKFDAIATRDYYALYGVLKSSRYQQAIIDDPKTSQEIIKQLEGLQKEIEKKALTEMKLVSHASTGRHSNDNQTVDSKYRELPLDTALIQGSAWRRSISSGAAIYCDPKTKQQRLRYIPEGVWDSGILSDRLEGAMRTTTFAIKQRYLHIEAAGWGGRIRVVVDGFNVIRDPIYGSLRKIVNEQKTRWYSFDLNMWKGRQAYVEFLDGGPADLSMTMDTVPGKEAWLQVRQMVTSEENRPPIHKVSEELEEAFFKIQLDGHAAWKDVLEKQESIEKQLSPARYCLATVDGNGSDESIFVRGNPHIAGANVPRGFSDVFCGVKPLVTGNGSGRLALAERMINARQNPFIARVIVNRVWKHHFGQGIVRSVDDFGHMGESPSHSELLDYLCNWFVEQGWSLKKLHREIVLSHTYRQGSVNDNPGIMKVDPQNVWLGRMPIRRLEAEAIRDAMLVVSGQLKTGTFDEGTMPYLTSLMQGRGRPSVTGPLDGAGRRSIYQSIRRNFLPAMMTAFDFPTPFTAIGRRSVSNIPAQSLTLMNDPLVKELAQKWASSMVKQYPDVDQRIEFMSLMAYGHPPSQALLKNVKEYLTVIEKNNISEETKAWTGIAHALFCSKEFIYLP